MESTEVLSVRIIRMPEVTARTGISRATIYRLMESKSFPEAVKIGARSVGWYEEEVMRWIKARPRARSVEH